MWHSFGALVKWLPMDSRIYRKWNEARREQWQRKEKCFSRSIMRFNSPWWKWDPDVSIERGWSEFVCGKQRDSQPAEFNISTWTLKLPRQWQKIACRGRRYAGCWILQWRDGQGHQVSRWQQALGIKGGGAGEGIKLDNNGWKKKWMPRGCQPGLHAGAGGGVEVERDTR